MYAISKDNYAFIAGGNFPTLIEGTASDDAAIAAGLAWASLAVLGAYMANGSRHHNYTTASYVKAGLLSFLYMGAIVATTVATSEYAQTFFGSKSA